MILVSDQARLQAKAMSKGMEVSAHSTDGTAADTHVPRGVGPGR